MKVEKLPESPKELISRYEHLELGGKKIRCPYFMNLKRAKDLRAMVGKGTPSEIEMEAKIWEKLKGVDFSKMSNKDIREFLISRGIGVDCSGFVMHILNYWNVQELGVPIWSKFKLPNQKGFIRNLMYRLKPVEKLGAEIITNSTNSKKIEINEVKPGDVVRLKWKKKNSHHILLIEEVHRDENDKVKLIKYVHSIPFYGDDSGIKRGEIEITDINKPLEKQHWLETDENGVNHVLEGYLIQLKDNGLRRIKALEGLAYSS